MDNLEISNYNWKTFIDDNIVKIAPIIETPEDEEDRYGGYVDAVIAIRNTFICPHIPADLTIPGSELDLVWQYKLRGFNYQYQDVSEDIYKTTDFETYQKWCDSMDAYARQIIRYKKQVDKNPNPNKQSFQDRVKPWLQECFTDTVLSDKVERNYRFLEEALELVQSIGFTKEQCIKMIDHVYGRPEGEPYQEVGGVMVTLAALCIANGLDMHQNGETELARINNKETIEKVKAKQLAKEAQGITSKTNPNAET